MSVGKRCFRRVSRAPEGGRMSVGHCFGFVLRQRRRSIKVENWEYQGDSDDRYLFVVMWYLIMDLSLPGFQDWRLKIYDQNKYNDIKTRKAKNSICRCGRGCAKPLQKQIRGLARAIRARAKTTVWCAFRCDRFNKGLYFLFDRNFSECLIGRAIVAFSPQ